MGRAWYTWKSRMDVLTIFKLWSVVCVDDISIRINICKENGKNFLIDICYFLNFMFIRYLTHSCLPIYQFLKWLTLYLFISKFEGNKLERKNGKKRTKKGQYIYLKSLGLNFMFIRYLFIYLTHIRLGWAPLIFHS